MATYLIQDNIAHFYNNENVTVWFPETETVHIENHPISLMKTHGVKKIVNVPFKLNTEFVRYKQDDEFYVTEFDLMN